MQPSERSLYYLDKMGIDTWLLRSNKTQDKNFKQLELDVSNCTKCPLHLHRKQAIFSRGNTNASLMVIANGPENIEDQQGQLFAGNAFNLWLNMLISIGLSEQDVYITTVLKCKLPEKLADINVHPCSDYLYQQITYVSPKLIVAMGDLVAQTLLPTVTPLEKLRDQSLQYNNIPVIISHHPMYLLKQPLAKKQAYADLVSIKQYLT